MSYVVATANGLFIEGENTIPLSLPTRFPDKATPRIAAGTHIFVYANGRPVLWEYDVKGRRVSEMNVQSGVEDAVVCGGFVVVKCLEGVKVMRKSGKKWDCVCTLETPSGKVAIVAEGTSVVLVGDDVWAYDVETGRRTDVNVDTPLSCSPVVIPESPTLMVPTLDGMRTIPLGGDSSPPETYRIGGGFTATCMAASRRHVALADGQQVAVVSLDHGDVEIVQFEGTVDALAWIDGSTLAAKTSGNVSFHDISTGASKPYGKHSVTALHPILPRRQSERAAPRQPERVLSESNINIPAPKPSDKGPKDRVVSAPTLGKMGPPPVPKVTSRPLATPSNPMLTKGVPNQNPAPNPLLSRLTNTGDTLRIRPPSIPEGDERSPGTVISTPGFHSTDGPSWEAFDEMRREIANLQLDMLRMGRGLKNEIRSAVAPLVDELRESRETIARQAAELERLRRGF